MGHFIQLGGFLQPEKRVQDTVNSLKTKYDEVLAEVDFFSKKDDRTLVFFDDYAMGVDEVVQHISQQLDCPAFYFHIHDGDLWMYRFYASGKEVDSFNTTPGYWEDISEEERESWRGNPEIIAEHWQGVEKASIEKYLIDHESDNFDGGKKAYQTDEFDAWDAWQLTDFTAKLGLPYPDEED